MRMNSIQARLTAFLTAFLLLVATMSISSLVGIDSIYGKLDAVNRRWVSGTQMLEELGSRFADFRIAEGYRALAANGAVAMQADFLAQSAATKVSRLLIKYGSLMGQDDAGLTELGTLWAAYQQRHDTWLSSGTTPRLAEATYGGPLQKAYDALQLANWRMVNKAKSAADAQSAEGRILANRITMFVIALAVLASVLTIASAGLVVLRIGRPLRSITSALARLAAGERDVQVPDRRRNDEIGDMVKAFHVFVANADALAEAHRVSEKLSLHDALTGLPNRRRFAAEFEACLKSVTDRNCTYSVMLIDLDRFKPVNDLRGHAAGDRVLCEVAARLTQIAPQPGRVARLGGDEFAIIAETSPDPAVRAELTDRLAREVVTAVEAPINVGDAQIFISASIGIAIYPQNGVDADAILRAADLAMYKAKNDGRGTYRLFEESMDLELRQEAELATELRHALAEGEILPHYQPLVDMITQRITGFEVLARWHHQDKGFIPPDVFIPLVEKMGLLGELTRLILTQATREALNWSSEARLAVNVSPTQLQDKSFPDAIADILRREGFPPNRLELEVTETALAEDLGTVKTTIKRLQELGIKVALDDFGIGMSNLHHLRELKFDKIKIDRSFVQSMRTSVESEKIVFAALDLAHNLNLPAVAEGIENEETLQLLADHGCEFGQGYFFSRAVPGELANALLSAQDGQLKEHVAQKLNPQGSRRRLAS